MRVNLERIDVLVIACVGLAVRGIVSLDSYSGKSTPPMFGDYEAQRHWQEITHNLPAKEWYTNTTNNDLLYWGLDYPPLTAYHSYGLGLVAHRINRSYVELHESRGYESEAHKSFMRLTVLAADLCVLIPACILLAFSLEKVFALGSRRPALLTMLILYPGLILIDNGHFQYNNISLGLMLVAVSAVLRCSHLWSALFFSLALNYKQMELYHALPFFVYLLRISFAENTTNRKLGKLMQIAFITLATFAVLWLPWVTTGDSLMNTLRRLFPFNRGVFEDKVANVWCSLNVIYKLKENVNNSQMAVVCLSTTLLAILPVNLHIFTNFSKKTFLFSLFNTAVAFFLFSFQVHEKSILLAAIPMISLLPFVPFCVVVFLKVSVLSMFPLLLKDQLCVPYFCMMTAFSLIFKYVIKIDYSENITVHKILSILSDGSDVIILIISLAAIYIPSPAHLPHLWPLFISVFCCGGFIAILAACLIYQFNLKKYLNRIFCNVL